MPPISGNQPSASWRASVSSSLRCAAALNDASPVSSQMSASAAYVRVRCQDAAPAAMKPILSARLAAWKAPTSALGIVQTVFSRRTNDGKALVVHSPEACRGETTVIARVPPDLLPVVFDDAETLASGTVYICDDACDSHLSDLKIGGATSERGDRAAFEQFRREQPNVVNSNGY